jgi:hypothetical protein
MKILRITFFVITCSFLFQTVSAQEISSSNGLEVKEPEGIFVLVEGLSDDAKEIGLYESRIKNKVELRLRQADINVVSREENLDKGYDYYLYVNILVVGNSFDTSLQFKRSVIYSTDKLYDTTASVWDRGGAGTHGGSSEYIIDTLEPTIDAFINNFLKVN